MTRTVDALQVARAALAEVGLSTSRVSRDDAGLIRYPPDDDPLYYKASVLGLIAEDGPDMLIRCRACAPHYKTRERCTPARDALRGVTCG